ncbi:MAG TPA: RNA polymerase sigma-70 factor [Chitinophaga sp.]|uniref:RNA polymerase sigma factor n=1 Tax=Chitinophaga sp. TaxID=1869181 RepID=UPI002CE962A6|nr:RNA polymerase sigma-70 factor [Chitinophaga sp.]HVI44848.1 RNA polymerase sigma-70 factor [Chitinophaga sp.]
MIPVSASSGCDSLLLKQVADGDESAFRRLFDMYADRIYGVAFAYTGSKEQSEEIVQDVFMKIWLKREHLSQVENISNYIFIIARNLVINLLHRQKREKNYLQQLLTTAEEVPQSPESEYVLKESRRLITDAINQLSPQQRTVYQLTQIQGMKLAEAAAELGLSRNTARNHLARATQCIREYLRQHTREYTMLFVLVFLELL